MDYGEEGMRDTCDALDAAAVAHAGCGDSRRAAFAPAILNGHGRRVAIFSVTATASG